MYIYIYILFNMFLLFRFLPSKPAALAITATIEENYQEFWPTWGTLKDNERDHMFGSFRVSCNFYFIAYYFRKFQLYLIMSYIHTDEGCLG